MDPNKPAPPRADAKTARGTVAEGRTVSVQTGERHAVGRDSDGTTPYRHKTELRKPGQEVELPEAEIVILRASGFLVDPDAPVLKRDIGPTFSRKA